MTIMQKALVLIARKTSQSNYWLGFYKIVLPCIFTFTFWGLQST